MGGEGGAREFALVLEYSKLIWQIYSLIRALTAKKNHIITHPPKNCLITRKYIGNGLGDIVAIVIVVTSTRV